MKEIKKESNLTISRNVGKAQEEEIIDFAEVNQRLVHIDKEVKEARNKPMCF